ncbi:MAG: hypothetical protein GXY83_02405 [Rhodopirellula sp.]|nr:hypothetical protein [Rhodopirellula sp.]
MNHAKMNLTLPCLVTGWLLTAASFVVAAPVELHVAPSGADTNPGTAERPFLTLYRAQQAVRASVKQMDADVVVSLAPGDYRLDRTLEFTAADSGQNGFRVVYRSAAGPGKARLLGSVPLKGWQEHRDGIWKIDLPEGLILHTLYENGRRVHKARFPDHEPHPQMPTALGRYLVTVDGTPKQTDRDHPRPDSPAWLAYAAEDAPPVTEVTKMRIHIFPGGKCDWVREVHPVASIDPESRRLNINGKPFHGVGVGARYFLEDELGLLNAPGEFFVDDKAHTLYYMPLGKGHPDTLAITCPVLNRMIELKGASRDQCVQNLVLDGLGLEESDNAPPLPLWAYDGLRDGALVWMNNTSRVEIRDCHLKNSGRNGIMMIGHNTNNLVTGCWIEHMGVNGVSFCNRFLAPGGKAPTEDRCQHNRVTNTWISHVGELHTYAECVTVFNVSNNEVDHCRLDNSVRYAITLRGNTGPQYGPSVLTNHPPTKGNHFHHIRIERCGQDGGDMGALHGANLNIPGGDAINTFEQITVADCRAIPSVKDIAPDGIFIDWPKMCMHQVFRNVQIVRPQGQQLRSHGPDNGASAQTDNVSWEPNFDENGMDYAEIGLRPDFPKEYGGGSTPQIPPPFGLEATPLGFDRVRLTWQSAVPHDQPSPSYAVFRDGVLVGSTFSTSFEEGGLTEQTLHRYAVAARAWEFAPPGKLSNECEVRTPPDTTAPILRAALSGDDAQHVWLHFSKPLDPATAGLAANYRIDHEAQVLGAEVAPDPVFVRLRVSPLTRNTTYRLTVGGVTDTAAARNPIPTGTSTTFCADPLVLHYTMDQTKGDTVVDASGSGRHARLKGSAAWTPKDGRMGGALLLDGKDSYAEGPADCNLGAADFTLAAWIWKEHDGSMIILAKADGFAKQQWSWGWDPCCFRAENHMSFHPDPSDLGAKRWMHVAFVRRGNTGQAYVDGKASGGTHDLSVLGDLSNDQPLLVGRRRHEEDPVWFRGRIDDVRIYDRALTAEEVGILASGGVNGHHRPRGD